MALFRKRTAFRSRMVVCRIYLTFYGRSRFQRKRQLWVSEDWVVFIAVFEGIRVKLGLFPAFFDFLGLLINFIFFLISPHFADILRKSKIISGPY